MSLQISTGYGSLLAVGIGAHDVAAIYSIGRRFGNWYTASTGDQELLRLLDEDEMNLITRRGVLDAARFRAMWNNSMTLLSNGKKLRIEGKQANKALGEMSRFTACMICIVASLDAFATATLVQTISRRLMLELLRTTDNGEDLVASEISNRVNAWRSAGCIRGVHQKVRRIHLSLLKAGKVLNGTLVAQEAKEIVDFLYWLLAGQTESWTTCSSDLAGIACCLSTIGFDMLSVESFGGSQSDTNCRLIYDKSGDLQRQAHVRFQDDPFSSSRGLCTTISLLHPEEAMSVFPISQNVANSCRHAWKLGQDAGKQVELRLSKRHPVPTGTPAVPELRYAVVDLGQVCGRVDDGVYKLASSYGLTPGSPNEKLCTNLHAALMEHTFEMKWLLDQLITEIERRDPHVLPRLVHGTPEQINAFTVLQAFFMGYHYEVFLRLVDTDGLQIQIVDGAWGFRSIHLLTDLRLRCSKQVRGPPAKDIPRRTVVEILCAMLCSTRTAIENIGLSRDCIGFIGKRTLLCNSVLRDCKTPEEIGSFVLLDIDVGVLPSDSSGIIRSGVAQLPTPIAVPNMGPQLISDIGPKEDCTRHIEADWDVDPATALLCIRYKGRRLLSLNVAQTDALFCSSYVKPLEKVREAGPSSQMPSAISIGINELLTSTIPLPAPHPVFVQAHKAPCLGYAFAAIYQNWPFSIASNCVKAAWDNEQMKPRLIVESLDGAKTGPIVIARPSDSLTISYKVFDDDDGFDMRPVASLMKQTYGDGVAKEIEALLRSSIREGR